MKPFLPRLLVTAALAALPTTLAAQSSIFSVLGIGFPQQPLDVRARSLGGGVAAIEPRAALNPAAAAAFTALTAAINTEARIREYEVGATSASGLEETRFPFGMIGGKAWSLPLSFAVSFTTYADRTYDITTADTVVLRGSAVAVNDRQRSRGAITDIRGALGWAPSRRLSVGFGAHLLSGSADRTVSRTFDDPFYAPLSHENRETFQGYGVSVGATLAPVSAARLGIAVRKDGELDISDTGGLRGSFTLPTTVSGGFIVFPSPAVRWSGTAIWRSWSDMQDDLTSERAFDTWFVGSGLELTNVLGTRPVRIGARYETLPFSPGDEQATELTLSIGSGLEFAGNRALADFTLERSIRDGAGVSERVWVLSAAFVLVP